MISESIKSHCLAWVRSESTLLWLVAALCCLSSIFLLINHLIFHYSGLSYLSWDIVKFFPWSVGTFFIARYLRDEVPRVALFFDTVGKIYFLYVVMLIMCRGAQYTPFHLIDPALYQLDRWLGYPAATVLHFSQSHDWVQYFSKRVYQFLGLELFLLPLLLCFFLEKRSIHIFLVANFVATFMGLCFYYFFPTIGPMNVLPSTFFSAEQLAVVTQFHEMHHYLPMTIHVGEMVGCPSFHVIWAVLLTYLCRHRKFLLYPALIINALVLLSTLTLGWHFLASVLMGVLMSSVSLYLASCWTPPDQCSPQRLSVRESIPWLKALARTSFLSLIRQ